MEEFYEIGISLDGTYVYAQSFQHPYTAELALKLAGELTSYGEPLNVLGCLIDIRGTSSVSSITDKYQFAYEKASIMNLPRHWRFAFLVDQGDKSPSFIETVMHNAGYMFRIFNEEVKAIEWLKGTQSTQ